MTNDLNFKRPLRIIHSLVREISFHPCFRFFLPSDLETHPLEPERREGEGKLGSWRFFFFTLVRSLSRQQKESCITEAQHAVVIRVFTGFTTTPSRKLFKPTRQNILIGRSPRLRCRPAYPRSPRTKWTTRAPLLPPVAKSGEAIVDDSFPPSLWDKQRNAVIRRPTIISYAGRKGGSRCEKVSFSCEATKLLERVSNVAPLPGLTKRRLERARAYFFKKKINRRKATTNRDRDYYSWWGWFPRSWNIFFNNDDRNNYYKF